MSPSLQLTDALVTSCAQTLRQAVNFLLGKQHRDGYWWADLTADTTLESDYILLELWWHPPVDGVWPMRKVLEAAGRAGCQRIVYTSTVGCIGLPKELNGQYLPTTETDIIAPGQLTNDYKKSKFQAEAVAVELYREKKLPIVIVNPSAPIGPRDVKPTPTGQVIVDFLNRNLPAYLETGLNWVHVRDVAIGQILAAEKGRLGERYILGNAEGNWTHAANPDDVAGNGRSPGAPK